MKNGSIERRTQLTFLQGSFTGSFYSLMLHIGLFAFFLIAALFHRPAKIHIFELMPLSAYSATSTGASSDASGANAIALPAIKRIPTRKLEVPQKKVSYKEFVNTKGLPKKATAAVSVPKLQVKNITTANAKSAATSSAIGASGAAGTSNVPPSVLQQYLAKMRSDIEGFWEKPPAHTALKATVEFQISESGQLLYATIKEPSGSQPFDNSILKAFKQNPQWDQPPERKKMTFTLVFEAI